MQAMKLTYSEEEEGGGKNQPGNNVVYLLTRGKYFTMWVLKG